MIAWFLNNLCEDCKKSNPDIFTDEGMCLYPGMGIKVCSECSEKEREAAWERRKAAASLFNEAFK